VRVQPGSDDCDVDEGQPARAVPVRRRVHRESPAASPTPNPQPEPSPPGPQPDLVVTKRALQPRVDFGRIATFEIVVHNQGDAAAQQVIVADVPGRNAQLVSARPSKGSCNERTPLTCRLGRLDAGAPRINNQAVAGSATPESTLANNFDRARVRVTSRGGVRASSARSSPSPTPPAEPLARPRVDQAP
jgi:uncharacterized repeat protein (TIGR01451 family)